MENAARSGSMETEIDAIGHDGTTYRLPVLVMQPGETIEDFGRRVTMATEHLEGEGLKASTCPHCASLMLPRADGLGLVCPCHCAERLADTCDADTVQDGTVLADVRRLQVCASLIEEHSSYALMLARAAAEIDRLRGDARLLAQAYLGIEPHPNTRSGQEFEDAMAGIDAAVARAMSQGC